MSPLSKYKEVPPFVALGYQPKTTFWGDFGVADVLYKVEPKGIEDTYKRAFKCYKNDREYGTELAMVLNHKIWEWYEKDTTIASIYDKLWKELDAYIMNHWKGEDLKYYIETTD